MKRMLLTILLITAAVLALTACSAPANNGTPPDEGDIDTPSDDTDIDTPPDRGDGNDTPPEMPVTSPPGGVDLIDQVEVLGPYRGPAAVESIDVLILESWPLQVHVATAGTLQSGCTIVGDADSVLEGNTFTVTVNTYDNPDPDCTEDAVPFEYVVALDVYGLPAGTYTVDVNGVMGTFTFDADNAIDTSGLEVPDAGSVSCRNAPVDTVSVISAGSQEPEILISGYLPDGCSEITSISDRLDGDTIIVTVEMCRPEGMACTQAIVPYDINYVLTSVPGAGTYNLDVNDVVIEITVN